MPVVPKFEGGVRTRAISGGGFNVRTSRASFGTGAGFGAVADSLGTGTNLLIEEQNKADRAKANEVLGEALRLKNLEIYGGKDTDGNEIRGYKFLQGIEPERNKAEYATRYNKKLQNLRNNLNPQQRALIDDKFRSLELDFADTMEQHSFRETSKFVDTNYNATVESFSQDAILNYDSPGKVEEGRLQVISTIENWADFRGLSGEIRSQFLKTKESEFYVKLNQRIAQDSSYPDGAAEERALGFLSQVKERMIPSDYESALSDVENASRARLLRIERENRLREESLQQARTQTQDEFLKRVTNNELTPEDILQSNLSSFGSGSKNQFLKMLEERNKPVGGGQSNPAVFNSLFARINAADDDPNRITDENDLNQFVGRGLSYSDLTKLRGEMQGRGSAEGKIEAELKKRVMSVARSKMVKSNPMLGIVDPKGEENFQRFTVMFLNNYSEQRRKGKTANDLLNPDSPDYIAKDMDLFVRDANEIIQDLVPRGADVDSEPDIFGPPSANANPVKRNVIPRKEGETPAEYLKRIEGK